MAIYRGMGTTGTGGESDIVEIAQEAIDAAAAAEAAQAAAETAETNAELAETNAETAASQAESHAYLASLSDAQATSSATSAANSASTATTQATNAANSATSASTSASNASTSATNAANSATSASTSASTATTQATNAANSATAAASSASAASTSATNAASSASTATTQATNASNSASAAATSATNASNSASAASTSATNASNSATSASTSATNAAASAAAAAATVTSKVSKSGDVMTGSLEVPTEASLKATALTRASIRPSLLLDFANTKQLDPRITYSRASTGTFYDGKSVVKAEENLLAYSQEITVANWSTEQVSKVANIAVAPDGTYTADSLADDTSTNIHRTAQNFTSVSGQQYAFSVYLKNVTIGYAQLLFGSSGFDGGAWANFDLATGVLGTVGAAATATITSVGNGWYRCSIVATATASASVAPNVLLIQSATSARAESYAGTGKTLYIWGAQLEQRSSVSSYTPTTTQPITNYIPALQTAAAGVARFDHDPVTGESKGLLIEEQRTNLLTYSEQFDNAAWSAVNGVLSANVNIAPDGTLTGDVFRDSTATVSHAMGTSVAVTSGTVYTCSCYMKAAGRNFGTVRALSAFTDSTAFFNLSTGSVGSYAGSITSSSITNVGNGWYRCSITLPASSTASATIRVGCAVVDGFLSYTGDGYSGIYIWGAQLEAGAFPTSYIQTVASQVTRSADAASMTGTNFSSWYRGDEGTVLSEQYSFSTMTASQSVSANKYPNPWAIGNTYIQYYGAGAELTIASAYNNIGPIPTLQYNKIAIAVSSVAGQSASSINGSSAASRNGVTFGANQTSIGIGSNPSNVAATVLNGYLKRLAYYPKRLSNTELQGITS